MSRTSTIFILCCLVGGMGWICIPSQLHYMPAEMAVGYRFIIAGLITLLIARLHCPQHQPKLAKDYGSFFIQGIFMFSINYILAYYALHYVLSGIVAVIISMLVIPNAIMEFLFFKRPYTLKKIGITLIGVFGVVILYLSRDHSTHLGPSLKNGLICCALSMLSTSFGANISQYLKRSVIDPIWAVGFAMLFGGIASLIYASLYYQTVYFPLEAGFIVPLTFLALLSCALFIGYQILLTRQGAGFAAYIWVITPAVSLTLSAFYEDLMLSPLSLLAIAIIVSGGFFNLGIRDKT